MAFREKAGEFVIPSVVHWKMGHYAALLERRGDLYLLADPTFGNTVWATRSALIAETSGYFLIPAGKLPLDWRGVEVKEGQTIWGKGVTASNDPDPIGKCDPTTSCDSCVGMATSRVHLMNVNLNINDQPVGHVPPVGPDVRFTVRYNHRDAAQPGIFSYSNFGPKWTSDWFSHISDNPQNPLADVAWYMPGGGVRRFTNYDTNTQSYSHQQYDGTFLTRTGGTYQLHRSDGSTLVFNNSDGSVGTTRKVFLSQFIDPVGNTVALNYDGNLRLVSIIDAIGQSTTLTYGLPGDIYKITKVTDPFGRFAQFDRAVVETR